MKTCPVCGSRCFDDMDTCYGCMHKFTTKTPHKNVGKKQRLETEPIPEYFEMEPFAYIEEVGKTYQKAAHAKPGTKSEEKIKIKLEIPKSVLKKYLV